MVLLAALGNPFVKSQVLSREMQYCPQSNHITAGTKIRMKVVTKKEGQVKCKLLHSTHTWYSVRKVGTLLDLQKIGTYSRQCLLVEHIAILNFCA